MNNDKFQGFKKSQNLSHKKEGLNIGLIFLLIMLVIFVVEYFSLNQNQAKDVSYSDFINLVNKDAIDTVQIIDESEIYAKISLATDIVRDSSGKSVSSVKTIIPYQDNTLLALLNEKNITIIGSVSGTPFWYYIIDFLPVIFMFIMMMVIIRQGQGQGNKAFQFGKSRAQRYEGAKKLTFADVAGQEEAKEELEEVVDFLRNPEKYNKMGARIPKGVLLVGMPGTGKTLLARAVAGEAGVAFFHMSGSDFVEMFVGVGASRVRDLFNNAKKNAPSIIFIDEIDAIGRRRGNGTGGGNDEREQTLNQLLVEMDGFEGDEGVIVIAATNRSDVLDPALLRPGRFDRKVLVGRPDVRGREAILKVHAKNKPLAPDVDLKEIARQTPGFVGADLANVLNEAALVAARRNGTEITASDIDEAEDRVIAGPAKKDRLIAEPERRRVAFHEAGHSICGLVLSDSRTVRKVTIVPRGRAGGYNIMLPKDDQFILTKKQLFEQIVGLMGGRAGEEATIGDKSTGASNDFEQATAIAHSMVVNYGMTDSLGMVELEKEGETNPYGFKPYSEATSAKIDEAVKKILDEAHAKALEIVKENKEKHRIIAEALLKYETLDEKQIMSLYKTGKMPEKYESEYPSESKASTYEEAKAAAEKREVEKAEKKDSDQALADQEKDALETPSEKNHEVEEHNAENPEKNQNTDSTKTDSPAEDDEHKDN